MVNGLRVSTGSVNIQKLTNSVTKATLLTFNETLVFPQQRICLNSVSSLYPIWYSCTQYFKKINAIKNDHLLYYQPTQYPHLQEYEVPDLWFTVIFQGSATHRAGTQEIYLSNDIMGIRLRQMDFLNLLGSEELLSGIRIQIYQWYLKFNKPETKFLCCLSKLASPSQQSAFHLPT